jgi:hypothetical protein
MTSGNGKLQVVNWGDETGSGTGDSTEVSAKVRSRCGWLCSIVLITGLCIEAPLLRVEANDAPSQNATQAYHSESPEEGNISPVQSLLPLPAQARESRPVPQPAGGSTRKRPVRDGALHHLFGVTAQVPQTAARARSHTSQTQLDLENKDDACADDVTKPIGALGTNIAPSFGELPPDYAAACFARYGSVVDNDGASREPIPAYFFWQAPGLCHGPLYFEEVNLERYGYSAKIGQPILSGIHFFTRVPMLPYLAVAYPPDECIGTLGHYRPGDCVPFQIHRIPFDWKAAAFQSAVVTGLVFLIP